MIGLVRVDEDRRRVISIERRPPPVDAEDERSRSDLGRDLGLQ